MSRLTRDGTAEPVPRDQILRPERGQGNIHFSCSSADHVQDWQPYPVDPYSCYMCDHTYMHRVWVKTKLRGNDEDDQVGIFNMIQKNPNTGVHLKVDEAVEGCTWK